MKTRIGLYEWEIRLSPRKEIQGNDGQTRYNEFVILIADDLTPSAKEISLRHEVIHALLGTQGRAFQRKFDVEELCEFIAWKLPEINDIMSRFERWFVQ